MHKKVVLLSLVTAGVLACSAQKAKTPYWLDPAMNRVGTVAPHSDYFAFETVKAAQEGDKTKSSRYLSLEGKWKFSLQRTTTKPRKTSLSRVTTILRGKTSQYLDCLNSMVMAMPFIVM